MSTTQRAIFSRGLPSDLLPPKAITRPGTVIINADQHTRSGSHWLAIRLEPKSSNAFYFDSDGLPPLVPVIQLFLRRTSSVWEYKSQLQGLTSTVCGHYRCLFALCLDEGLSPRQYVSLLGARHADERVLELLASRFGSSVALHRGGQCCSGSYIRCVTLHVAITCRQNADGMELVIDYESLKGLNDEIVVKEVGLAGDNVYRHFILRVRTRWCLMATW
jgi:hypothetical protein